MHANIHKKHSPTKKVSLSSHNIANNKVICVQILILSSSDSKVVSPEY